MSHLYNLLQRFAWWGGNTCHPLTRLIQTACSSAVVHPHPDIYWEEMWPFHYVSSAGVCILVVSPATMMSNVPPKKNVKRDSCIPQVSRWFIFSINYQSSVLIPRCCTGEGCVKVIKVSQFYWVKLGRRRRTTESFTNLTKWNQSAAGFTSEPATRQHVYFWINEYHPFFFPELFWIHKSEAVFQKHSNSEAHLMHPQLTSTLSSL